MPAYTYEDLEAAMQEYLKTDKSQYQIAREYGIPRSTLNDHIRRLFGYVDKDMGRRALGLPSVKVVSDKSELLASVISDMSEETETNLPDISERRKVREGKDVLKVILVVGLIVLISFALWRWWQWQRELELKLKLEQLEDQLAKSAQAKGPAPQKELEKEIEKYNKLFGLN